MSTLVVPKRHKRFTGKKVTLTISAWTMGFLFFAPYLQMLLTALKPKEEITAIPATYLPKKWAFENFIGVWKEIPFSLLAVLVLGFLANDVLIETEAFGLNYADVMARRGLYREAPAFPCVIGYEVVGTIIQTGSSVDITLIGKRVVAFTRFGGYAKHVITTKDAIAEIGKMPVNDALALATQGVTAYYMSNYISPVRTGEHVLIHAAAGGVGTLLIQLAKQAGAIVIAKVSSKEK